MNQERRHLPLIHLPPNPILEADFLCYYICRFWVISNPVLRFPLTFLVHILSWGWVHDSCNVESISESEELNTHTLPACIGAIFFLVQSLFQANKKATYIDFTTSDSCLN